MLGHTRLPTGCRYRNRQQIARGEGMDNPRCTLDDLQLIEKAKLMVNDLAQTGGRSWTMRVPVDFDRDHDMIFSEVINRFEKLAVSKLFPDDKNTENSNE